MAGGESGTAYYNEIDAYAAAWLRNLISRNLIAPGEVDERSIEDVPPDDLRGFTQCHFFAGIGVWSYALRGAGWPDDRAVWTGSCPCQPFSAAGKRGGTADERHLWPAFHHLIDALRPAVVLGEQVASKDGLAWFDTVYADLEASGYAVGATDLCAAGVGAPHIRQRLWFVGVADAVSTGWTERRTLARYGSLAGCGASSGLADAVRGGAGYDTREGVGTQAAPDESDGSVPGQRLRLGLEGSSCGLDDDDDARSQGHAGHDGSARRQGPERPAAAAGVSSGLAEPNGDRQSPRGLSVRPGRSHQAETVEQRSAEGHRRPGPTNGLWRDADWLSCRDGKWRPVESGTFPLAHGAPARVGRLRAYGNAIVAEAAREFIEAVDWAIGGDLA